MLKNILLVILTFLCLLAVTGSLLFGPDTQRLTANDASGTVELMVGDRLEVTLEGNPSTGYTWETVPADGGLLKQIGEPEIEADSDLPGAPGQITLRFKAVASGEETLKLVYHRAWETETEHLDTFEVTLIIK